MCVLLTPSKGLPLHSQPGPSSALTESSQHTPFQAHSFWGVLVLPLNPGFQNLLGLTTLPTQHQRRMAETEVVHGGSEVVSPPLPL